jgi:hypothetical protein
MKDVLAFVLSGLEDIDRFEREVGPASSQFIGDPESAVVFCLYSEDSDKPCQPGQGGCRSGRDEGAVTPQPPAEA